MKVLYPAENTVSIWIGTFTSEDEFDDAVDTAVEPRLNLDTELAAICEVAFKEEPVSIDQLLEGFSGWESFARQACLAAAERNIRGANSALVCYYLRCSDESDHWGKMTFLGTFSGSDILT